MSTAELTLHLVAPPGVGSGSATGALVDVMSLDARGQVAGVIKRDVDVPLGETYGPARLALPPGGYMVQLRLPSGRVRNTQVTLADGETRALALPLPTPVAEGLEWQTYLGDAPSRPAAVATDGAVPAADVYMPAPPTTRSLGRGEADDLTRIEGLTPAVADALAKRGITRFAQLAALTERERRWLFIALPETRATAEAHRWFAEAERLAAERGPAGRTISGGGGEAVVADDAADVVADDLVSDAASADDGAAQTRPGPDEPRPHGALPGRTGAPWVDDLKASAPSEPEFRVIDLPGTTLDGVMAREGVFGTGDAAATAPLGRRGAAGGAEVLRGGSVTTVRAADGLLAGAEPGLGDSPETAFDLCVLAGHAGLRWLVRLPAPWRTEHGAVGFDLTFDDRDPTEPRVALLPRDPELAPLLGYMRAEDVRASLALVERANSFLYGKLVNPFAAAAGGYVLVNCRRWGAAFTEPNPEWREWIGNLHAFFPTLPDAGVLQAWLDMLDAEDQVAATSAFRERLLAVAAGPMPYYTGVLRLLLDGLRHLRIPAKPEPEVVSGSGSEAATDPVVAAALARLDLPALRLDPCQVFTTLRLTAELPAERSGRRRAAVAPVSAFA